VTAGAARQHLMRARATVRGAVTAITPYPLIARLAEAMTAGPPPWVDTVAGAGASATIAKLTAGVAATGALVGGVVGTSHIVTPREPAATAKAGAATVRDRAIVRKSAVAATIVPVVATRGGSAVSEPVIHRPSGLQGGDASSGNRGRRGGSSGRSDDRSSGGSGDDGQRTATPNHGEDDQHGASGRGQRGTSGSGSGSGDDENAPSGTKRPSSGTSGSGKREDDAAPESSSGSSGSASGSGSGHESDDTTSAGPSSGTPAIPEDPPETPSPTSGSGRGRDSAAPSGGGGSGSGGSSGSGSSHEQPPAVTVPSDD
jgi:hypothetical protein